MNSQKPELLMPFHILTNTIAGQLDFIRLSQNNVLILQMIFLRLWKQSKITRGIFCEQSTQHRKEWDRKTPVLSKKCCLSGISKDMVANSKEMNG